MENNEEIKDQDIMDEFSEGGFKQWFRDNLRIIISVLIVVIIAGGIYSYSKRAEAPIASDETQIQQEGNGVEKVAGVDETNPVPGSPEENKATTEEQKQPETKAEPTKTAPDNTSSVATSQETEKSFIETAARGDNSTKLARRALANYLEKNTDSSLTVEHKIYIEDYLRKHAGQNGSVKIGGSMEFSKDLIQEAITKSKNLNSNQLKNLHKYAVRVPSLS